jgi:hypothetical protein
MKRIELFIFFLLISGSILAQTEPVRFFVRGTGLFNHNSRVLIIGSQTIYNTQAGRGLRLTVINKTDQVVVSDQVYDCYADATSSDNLASALNQISNLQIGVLTSLDAWESNVNVNLDAAFYRLGLVKACATVNSGCRRPYAAIFEGAAANEVTSKAVEVSYSATVNQPYAEISGFFYNGTFVATGSQPNALLKPQGDGIGVIVDGNGNVGIGTTNPGAGLDVNTALPSPAVYETQSWSTNNPGYNLRLQTVWDANGINQRIIQRYNSVDYTSLAFYKGNIGIGILNPTHKLEVNGTIRAKEIKVEAANWPDYVFGNDYSLKSLSELDAYIKEHKHLPEMPSAAQIEKEGVDVGKMNRILVQKIEELTLYSIKQNNALTQKEGEIEQLKGEVDALKKQFNELKTLLTK